jgi:hypothetical protein
MGFDAPEVANNLKLGTDGVDTAIAIETHDKYTTQLFYLGMIRTKGDRFPICWDVSEIW